MTDVLRNGQRLECFFNDKEKGFHRIKTVNKAQLDAFPNVSFSDPRIRVGRPGVCLSDPLRGDRNRLPIFDAIALAFMASQGRCG